MAKLFADIGIGKKTGDAENSLIVQQFMSMHTEKVASMKKLLRVPDPGEITFLWTMKSFNAFTFIPFCIEEYGRIDEVYLSSYTISKRITDAIIKLVQSGKVGFVHIFVSDSLKYRMPAVVHHLDTVLALENRIKITYAWNHSKITCIKSGENHLVLEGSGNWSENAQYEQYVLSNSKKVYEFRKSNISPLD